MRIVPKEWRREGVLESLKNTEIKAMVDEAEYNESLGYYDEDGNWVYYETEVPEPQPQQPPQQNQQQKQQQNQQQNQQNQQKRQQQLQQQQEVKAAADEAAKAAQEAAKAAKEASASLAKGFASFGFGGGNKKQSGGFLGGLVKAATIEPTPNQKQQQQQQQIKKAQPLKPKVKPQDPNFPKPYTNNMNAKQRWQWAYRRLVQVFSLVILSLDDFLSICNKVKILFLFFSHFLVHSGLRLFKNYDI